MTTISTRASAEDDLLSNAQFDPIFDQHGNLVDIAYLEIPTDRSRGVRAMEELAATEVAGDSAVYGDGFTGRWKRILNTPAPGAAHTIKQSKRWDSQTGEFVPSATLMLPFEVVWTLFERLFFGRYSIHINEIVFNDEDVPESPVEGARNLPGRVFYARASVSITLHLENNQTRVYTALGVAYDSVRAAMTGNVYAINSARRMAEKGAVSDAKREVLATMGRVFTRAFEDGNEALRAIEAKILEKIRKPTTTNSVRARTSTTVAAPRRNESHQGSSQIEREDNTPEGYIPMEAAEERKAAQAQTASKPNVEKSSPAPKAKSTAKQANTPAAGEAPKGGAKAPKKADEAQGAATKVDDAPVDTGESTAQASGTNAPVVADKAPTSIVADAKDATKATAAPTDAPYTLVVGKDTLRLATPEMVFESIMEALEGASDTQERAALLERNKTTLLRAEKADGTGALTYGELEAMIPDADDANASDDDENLPGQDTVTFTSGDAIKPAKETGDAILAAYADAFAAKGANVDAILMANIAWAKRLTNRQTLKLVEMATAAKTKAS